MNKFMYVLLILTLARFSCYSQERNSTNSEKLKKAQDILNTYSNQTTLVKGSKEYNLCYDKLKQLELKMINSPEYATEIWLYKSFMKKLNRELDVNLSLNQDDFFRWIEENINDTEFKNVEIAKEDWLRLREAREKVNKQNLEYFDYLKELTLNYSNSHEVISAVKIDVNTKKS